MFNFVSIGGLLLREQIKKMCFCLICVLNLNFVCFFGRLFNLASDVMQPEQEYYLQPVQPGRSRNAASICPVDFSFGGDHMWDRFSVSSVDKSHVL